MTRNVIFCGAGESKSIILKDTFSSMAFVKEGQGSRLYQATLATPAPYPSGMVSPYIADDSSCNSLSWIVDADAMSDVTRLSKQLL